MANPYMTALLGMMRQKDARRRATEQALTLGQPSKLAWGLDTIAKVLGERQRQKRMDDLMAMAQMSAAEQRAAKQRSTAFNQAMGMYRAGVAIPGELATAAGMPGLAKLKPSPKAIKPSVIYRNMVNPETGKPGVYRITTTYDANGQGQVNTEYMGEAPVMSMYPGPVDWRGLMLRENKMMEDAAKDEADTAYNAAYKTWLAGDQVDEAGNEIPPPEYNDYLNQARLSRGLPKLKVKPDEKPAGPQGAGPGKEAPAGYAWVYDAGKHEYFLKKLKP